MMMANEASVTPLRDPKYFGLPPEKFEDYTIGVEKLSDMKDEIALLFQEHWDETETKYLNEELAPDWDMLLFLAQQNRLIIFTARNKEGAMVGDIMYQLGHHAHMKGKLVSKEDNFFVRKSSRGAGLAKAMLRYAVGYHRHLGVKYMGMSDKSPVGGNSLKSMMESEGFKQNAVHYMMKL